MNLLENRIRVFCWVELSLQESGPGFSIWIAFGHTWYVILASEAVESV